MEIELTPLEGMYVLHRKVVKDERGFFSRLFSNEVTEFVGSPNQAFDVNSSFSVEVGTLRGIHFQYPPYAEAKVVSCVSGSIWDVGVDLRPNSPTRFQWFAKELTPDNGISLIIPEGFGHAFITLKPNSTVVYVVSEVYSAENESGILFNDPTIGIQWPFMPSILSEKDSSWDLIERRREEIDIKFCSK